MPRAVLDDIAPGGGCHTWDMVFLEELEQGKGEVHFTHQMDGNVILLAIVENLVEIVGGQLRDVVLVLSRVDLWELEVDDFAVRLSCL